MTTGLNLDTIRELRKLKKFTQTEMAEALGLKYPSTYLRREDGTYDFKTSELPLLSHKLGIPIDNLFK